MRYWIEIDRAAWVLFVSMIVYFIIGYGMTMGIIDARFSTKMHLDILPIVALLAFVLHTGFASQLALKRWNIWNGFSAIRSSLERNCR
jgi:hypothetical protein